MLLSLWNYAKSVSKKYFVFQESKNQLSSLYQKNIYFYILNNFIDTHSYRYRLRTLIRTRIDLVALPVEVAMELENYVGRAMLRFTYSKSYFRYFKQSLISPRVYAFFVTWHRNYFSVINHSYNLI